MMPYMMPYIPPLECQSDKQASHKNVALKAASPLVQCCKGLGWLWDALGWLGFALGEHWAALGWVGSALGFGLLWASCAGLGVILVLIGWTACSHARVPKVPS